MLRAERTGRLMSPSRVLSRRRCKRRLRRASCWRILVFTRNLLGLVFDVASLLHETPQKPERFRVFGKKFRKIATDFAYLGANVKPSATNGGTYSITLKLTA